jgi:hypothetical protein
MRLVQIATAAVDTTDANGTRVVESTVAQLIALFVLEAFAMTRISACAP